TFCPTVSSLNSSHPRGRKSNLLLLARSLLLGRGLLCGSLFLAALPRCTGSLALLRRSGLRRFISHYRCQTAVSRRCSFLRQRNLDVRHAPLIAIRPAHGRGTNSLHTRTFIGDRALDVEVVNIDVDALLLTEIVCVLDGRAQQLA